MPDLTERAFAATHTFVRSLVSPLAWPQLEQYLARQQARRAASPADRMTDILPALACRAAGGAVADATALSAAWLLHLLAGRIFDDLQDEGRRWRDEIHPVPAGLSLVGLATQALARLPTNAATGTAIAGAFGRTMALAAKGQDAHCTREDLSVQRYFEATIAKTGLVFATATWAGARLATTSPAILEASYNYGLATGVMVQIGNDCQDLEDANGSPDLAQGIMTLPIIYALSLAEHPRHPDLAALLKTPTPSLPQTREISAILADMDAVAWSRRMAEAYRLQALAALESLPAEAAGLLVTYVSSE